MSFTVISFAGSHENIVGYYSSWFENEQLYIQMELCDHSLSIRRTFQLFTEGEVLQALHQVRFFLGILYTNLIVRPCNK
jgi:wee1-like protein kinase